MVADGIVAALDELKPRLDAADREIVDQAIALVQTMGTQLAYLRRLASQPYRPKSEKTAPGQLALDFLREVVEAAQKQSKPEEEAERTPRQPRSRPKSNIDSLPVKRVEKKLSEDERGCPCCGDAMEPTGWLEPKRILIHKPAELYIEEQVQETYGCGKCDAADETVAPSTPTLIEDSMASSGFLAHMVTAKVVDGLPIDRLAKKYARQGAQFATSTLYNWYARCAEEMAFIGRIAHEQLLSSQLISLDDTHLPTQLPGDSKHITRGRLWMYVGDVNRVAFCDYSEDWKGVHPKRVLDGFTGDIQNDGYGGINGLFSGTGVPMRVGCNDHCRRKWKAASELGDKRADGLVQLYVNLYDVERFADQNGIRGDGRLSLRQERSAPIWQQMQSAVDVLRRGTSPKSPLGKAITYWTRQQEALSAFLRHGHLPISNIHVEQLIRVVALLRKNMLFVGSPEAGRRFATLMTVAANCILCGVDMQKYLTHVFDAVALRWPAKRAHELMPRAWSAIQIKEPIAA